MKKIFTMLSLLGLTFNLLAQDEQLAQFFRQRGDVYRSLGDKQSLTNALSDYTEAIMINPNYVLAYEDRAEVRYAVGDKTGSIQDFSVCIELVQQNRIGNNIKQ